MKFEFTKGVHTSVGWFTFEAWIFVNGFCATASVFSSE